MPTMKAVALAAIVATGGPSAPRESPGAAPVGGAAAETRGPLATCMAPPRHRAAAAGRLTVLVYQATPCLPVRGAAVELPALRRRAVTGGDGLAVLDGVPPGRHELRVRASFGRARDTAVAVSGDTGTTFFVDVGR